MYLRYVSPLLIKIFPKSAIPSISVALLSVASQNPLPAAPPLRGLCMAPITARVALSSPISPLSEEREASKSRSFEVT
jgi:hypothetical protein